MLGYPDFPYKNIFPGPHPKPEAEVYLLTTYRDPHNANASLRPLYRLSRQQPHFNPSNNTTNTNNIDHAYCLDESIYACSAFTTPGQGYKIDGIEGYIYPTPRSDTVALYAGYNSDRNDHAVFPADKLNAMQAAGYDQQNVILGYVYPNVDSDSDGLINGFELSTYVK